MIDPSERRGAILRLHAEGWNNTSIAGYLGTTRRRVLSTRTCGRILARNRKLYGLRGPRAKPREPKPMPFQTYRRHQYWTVDVR
jgi:hypothetical protein